MINLAKFLDFLVRSRIDDFVVRTFALVGVFRKLFVGYLGVVSAWTTAG